MATERTEQTSAYHRHQAAISKVLGLRDQLMECLQGRFVTQCTFACSMPDKQAHLSAGNQAEHTFRSKRNTFDLQARMKTLCLLCLSLQHAL